VLRRITEFKLYHRLPVGKLKAEAKARKARGERSQNGSCGVGREGEDGDEDRLAKFVNLGLGKCHTERIEGGWAGDYPAEGR
jgi:hypothetical protein